MNELISIDLNAATAFAQTVRNTMYLLAFLVFAAGIVRGIFHTQGNPNAWLAMLMKVGILTALMVLIPTYLIDAADLMTDSFEELSNTAFQNDKDSGGEELQKRMDSWMVDFYSKQKIKEDELTGWVIDSMVKTLGDWIIDALVWLSRIFRVLVRAVQHVLLLLMMAISPLMFAFGSFPETQSIFISFSLNTLAIVLWGVGFAFADLILFAGMKLVVALIAFSLTGSGATAAGAAHIIGAPISISVMIAICGTMLGLTVALNILGPLVITALMNGKSPAAAAMQSAQMGIQLSNAVSNLGRTLNTPRDQDHQPGGQTALGKSVAGVKGRAAGLGAMLASASGTSGSPSIFQTGGFSAAVNSYKRAYGQSVSPKSGSGKNNSQADDSHSPEERKKAKLGKEVPLPPEDTGNFQSDNSANSSSFSPQAEKEKGNKPSKSDLSPFPAPSSPEANSFLPLREAGASFPNPGGKRNVSKGNSRTSADSESPEAHKASGAEKSKEPSFTEMIQSSHGGMGIEANSERSVGENASYVSEPDKPVFKTGSLNASGNMSKEELHNYKADK